VKQGENFTVWRRNPSQAGEYLCGSTAATRHSVGSLEASVLGQLSRCTENAVSIYDNDIRSRAVAVFGGGYNYDSISIRRAFELPIEGH